MAKKTYTIEGRRPKTSANIVSFYAKKSSKIPKLDATAICTIITKHASPYEFNDCWMVDKLSQLTKHIVSVRHKFDLLKNTFHNKQFDLYIALNWHYLKGKRYDGFDYKTHNAKKETELSTNFIFGTKRAATYFFKKIIALWNNSVIKRDELVPSLCSIICNNIKSNFTIGAHLFNFALTSQIGGINLYPILHSILESPTAGKHKQLQIIKKIILGNKCEIPFKYISSYFEIVPEDYLLEEDCDILISAFDKISNGVYFCIDPSGLLKMTKLKNRWMNVLMEHIYSLNQTGRKISFLVNFHNTQWLEAIDDECLKEKIYLQQLKITDHFDYQRKMLQRLLLSRPMFIVDFAKSANAIHEIELSKIIWTIPEIEISIEYILNRVDSWSISSDHFLMDWEYVFFSPNIEEVYHNRINTFLRGLYNKSKEKDQVFRIARKFNYALYEELVLNYLGTATIDEFMGIDWTNERQCESFVNTTYGEVLKTRWEALLSIINKSQSNKRFPIIAQIKQQIRKAEESTREEIERDIIFD